MIGLSIARALSLGARNKGKEVFVLESKSQACTETSSRNSGVIHAGIYYRPHSQKNFHCLRGKDLLRKYLQQRNLPINQCGKLVVATSDDQNEILGQIAIRCRSNKIEGISILSGQQVRDLEPQVRCTKGLLVPETSVFDVHSFGGSILNDCEESGKVSIVLNCKFLKAEPILSGGFVVTTSHGDLEASTLVNAAGLHAPHVASLLSNYPRQMVPKMYFAKGNYFKLSGSEHPFERLIYPIPEKGGLGVHATIDVDGSVRFGPDVEWLRPPSNQRECVEGIEDPFCFKEPPDFNTSGLYDVNISRTTTTGFYSTIRTYFPNLRDDSLHADYSGVRPKLVGPTFDNTNTHSASSRDVSDFLIEDVSFHGVPGLINLFGIESPGLTSSLSIAEHVEKIIGGWK